MSEHVAAKSTWGTMAFNPKEPPPKPALATNLPPLIERECACGCKRKFKVLESSPLVYASRGCERKLAEAARDAKLVSKLLKRPLIDRSAPKDLDDEDSL